MPNKIHLPVDERFFEPILNGLDGVAITDAQGRYIYVSESWSRLMGGLTIEQVKGKYVKDCIPDTLLHKALDERKAIVGHPVKILQQDSGQAFTSYYPLFDNGELIGAFVHVIFIGIKHAMAFSYQVNELATQLEFYKDELRKIQGSKYTIDNIIGNSPPIARLKESIERAAMTNSTVMIEGETGTGKELVAHSIHSLSTRKHAPMIKVNCAAIPSELLESEFFGYEEGSFTGAKKGGKKGKFEMAQGGTLFLDEINHLPSQLQPKLLRVLQEWEVEPIGSKVPVPINLRLIVAINTNMEKLVKEKKFRSDLYYRLNVVRIILPPLRERMEDIPLISYDILEKLNHQLGMVVEDIRPEVFDLFRAYAWPGNVRELQNVIERGMNMSRSRSLEAAHVEEYFKQRQGFSTNLNRSKRHMELQAAKTELELNALLAALESTGNNRTKAAQLLGISRSMLYKMLNKHDIK